LPVSLAINLVADVGDGGGGVLGFAGEVDFVAVSFGGEVADVGWGVVDGEASGDAGGFLGVGVVEFVGGDEFDLVGAVGDAAGVPFVDGFLDVLGEGGPGLGFVGGVEE
jgi:hypothetical protein